MQLILNLLSRFILGKKFTNNVIADESFHRNQPNLMLEIILNRLNLVRKKYPPMKPKTKILLEEFYKSKNYGLSSLIKKNISQYWNYMS